jgi:hypothetical protein
MGGVDVVVVLKLMESSLYIYIYIYKGIGEVFERLVG